MLERSISDEVEAAIKAASADKHLETVRRVTDLFLHCRPTDIPASRSSCSATCWSG